MTTKTLNSTAAKRSALIKYKFMTDHDPNSAREVNTRFGYNEEINLEKMVRLATILEESGRAGTKGASHY